ncbi:hypothetical protein Tco_0381085 [Tanacetum coccineum]
MFTCQPLIKELQELWKGVLDWKDENRLDNVKEFPAWFNHKSGVSTLGLMARCFLVQLEEYSGAIILANRKHTDLSINSESTEVDAPTVMMQCYMLMNGNVEDDDVSHGPLMMMMRLCVDDDEVNPSTNVEEVFLSDDSDDDNRSLRFCLNETVIICLNVKSERSLRRIIETGGEVRHSLAENGIGYEEHAKIWLGAGVIPFTRGQIRYYWMKVVRVTNRQIHVGIGQEFTGWWLKNFPLGRESLRHFQMFYKSEEIGPDIEEEIKKADNVLEATAEAQHLGIIWMH